MRLVLDCSATMAWAFEDELDSHAIALLERLKKGEAYVPCIWPLEVCNSLLVSERKKRLTESDSAYFFSLLTTLDIRVDTLPVVTTFTTIPSLAREHKLSSYDAAYLELAMREGLSLATRDDRLKTAAQRAGLALFPG